MKSQGGGSAASFFREMSDGWNDGGRPGSGRGHLWNYLIKARLLAMGAVPTYATVKSHIASQRVAFQAEFIPAFYELFAKKL